MNLFDEKGFLQTRADRSSVGSTDSSGEIDAWADYIVHINRVPRTVLTFVLPVQVPKNSSVI